MVLSFRRHRVLAGAAPAVRVAHQAVQEAERALGRARAVHVAALTASRRPGAASGAAEDVARAEVAVDDAERMALEARLRWAAATRDVGADDAPVLLLQPRPAEGAQASGGSNRLP